MELEKYKIQEIITVSDVPLVLSSRGGVVVKSVYDSKPMAKLIVHLPFVYHPFKLLCFITVMKHEGVSFKRSCGVSTQHELVECYKGFLIDYDIDPNDDDDDDDNIITTLEVRIQITEIEMERIPKFRAVPA